MSLFLVSGSENVCQGLILLYLSFMISNQSVIEIRSKTVTLHNPLANAFVRPRIDSNTKQLKSQADQRVLYIMTVASSHLI